MNKKEPLPASFFKKRIANLKSEKEKFLEDIVKIRATVIELQKDHDSCVLSGKEDSARDLNAQILQLQARKSTFRRKIHEIENELEAASNDLKFAEVSDILREIKEKGKDYDQFVEEKFNVALLDFTEIAREGSEIGRSIIRSVDLYKRMSKELGLSPENIQFKYLCCDAVNSLLLELSNIVTDKRRFLPIPLSGENRD